jgi:hypothetical protein
MRLRLRMLQSVVHRSELVFNKHNWSTYDVSTTENSRLNPDTSFKAKNAPLSEN